MKNNIFWAISLVTVLALIHFFMPNYFKLENIEQTGSIAPTTPVPQELHYDTRLPASQNEKKAQNYFVASTIDDLQNHYKTKLTLQTTSDQKPYRLMGEIKLENSSNDLEAIMKLMYAISNVLEIDSPSGLKKPMRNMAALGSITTLEQFYENIPVEGAQVRIHQNSNGDVFMVNSTYQSQIPKIDTTAHISEAEAINLAKTHALTLDSQKRDPTMNSPQLVIYKFKNHSQNTDLCWRIPVAQPWLGGSQGTANYFINAHKASLQDSASFERVPASVE